MFLVVDANILFSFFRSESFTRELIRRLPNLGYALTSPDFVLEELVQDKERVKRYGEINETHFMFLLSLLEKKIDVIPRLEYEAFLPEARKLLPEHSKDAPYIALALKLGCSIWSNEKRLKGQSRIRVFSTRDLSEFVPKR